MIANERYDERMTKAEARAWGRAAREQMSLQERFDASRLITMQARGGLNWSAYRRVQLFLPITRLGEVDTWEITRWCLEVWPDVQIYLPRLVAGQMVQVAINRKTRFRESPLGIPEPVDGRVVREMPAFDLVLTPLLAFDRAGNRVGYGGGYYDRLLAGQPQAHKVGVAFAASEAPGGIAAEAHDVRLDAVVTERGLLVATQP
jgi:5-formyltetrahydrofolate cyclo-ligase